MKLTLKNNFALVASAIALLSAPALPAQVLNFGVDLNTAALNTQDSANAPFYLDFQLNYGDSTNPTSTVTLSNFQFTGGSALGSPTTTGTASGNLTSSVLLTASSISQLNELYQPFASSTTDIKFTASVTETGSGVTPTEFTTAILDSSLNPPAQLFTTAPDTASLVVLNLKPSNTYTNVGAYTSLTSADANTVVTGVAATITPVPEPSTTAAIVGCAVTIFACYARRFRKLPKLQTI